MKIGFYLAAYLPPGVLSLIDQGLWRHMARLIDYLIKDGHEILVACPKWLVNAMEELVEENNISSENIKLITPSADSVLWRIIQSRYQKGSKQKNKSIKSFF